MALTERLAILIDASSGGAVREFQKLSGAAGEADKKLTKGQIAAQGFKGALKAIGFAGAITGLVNFGRQAVDAASALEEVQSKAQVVFGSQFPAIQKFAEDTADAFNISERAAYQFTSAFGQLFDSAGLNSRQASEFSVTLTELAADIASFNDISVEEAFQKLRSGLSGEAEPLRQVGVFLSAAKVEAEAFASGIAETGSELTEAEKIQARYNIILKETATAQGDVARTSDSLANKQRSLNAQFEDLKATLGKELAGGVSDGTAALDSMLSVVNELASTLQEGDGGGIAGSITNSLRDLNPVIGAVIGQFEKFPEFIDEVSGANKEAERAQLDHGEAMRFANRAAASQVGALDEMAESASDAEGEIEDLADAITGLGKTTLDARSAQRDFEEAVDDARKALKENGQTATENGNALSIAGEKGRKNADALDAIADAGKEASAAVLLQTGSQKKANDVMQTARSRFIEAATAFGLSRDRAKELAREVGLIPSKKSTTYSTPGADAAVTAANNVKRAVDAIPNTKVVTVRVNNTSPGRAVLDKDVGGGYKGGWASDISGYAAGGFVTGPGSKTTDSVLARLSRGEFVVNADAAKNYAPLLEAINAGKKVAPAPVVQGDTFIIQSTTESVARDIESRQRIRSLAKRRAA